MIIDDLSIRRAGAGLSITRFSSAAGAWEIIWESRPGKTYAVEASPSLSPAQFSPVPGLEAVTASESSTSATDTRSSTTPAQFYRIVELP